MSTFNRLVRKAPPPVSNPWVDKDFEMNSEPEDEDLDAATATQLRSPFEPALNPGQAPSQKRSALPEGMATQVSSVLAFRRSQSPERHGTLQVEEEARLIRHKVRVVAYEDPRQALELEELKAQLSTQQEILSSFKKQLEDAGRFVQQAQEAQKAAEKEAAKFGEDARVAAESKRQAEEYAHNVTEVKRQADEQAAKEREAVRREMDDRIAKVVEDAEVRRKALEERTKIAEEALRVGANIGKNGKGKGKEVMANISDDEDDLMVEAQLRDREEETGTSVLEAEKCLTNDVDMDNADTHNGGNEVEEPETSMPGALDHIVQPNASNSEGRQESGPRKSSPKTSGTLAVAKNMVHDSYVPPIPKATRARKPIGGAGPRLKGSRPSPSPMLRTGERQTFAAPASRVSRPREHESSMAHDASGIGSRGDSFEETSLAMMQMMQKQIDLLMKNAKPQKRTPWKRPSEFKVASDRTREKERTSALNWIRKQMNKLLMIEKDNDIFDFTDIFNPKSSQGLEMARYEKDQRGEGPCLEPMVPNFKVLAGKWNEQLWMLFRDHCIEMGYADEAGHMPEEDEEEIREIFFQRLTRLKYLLNTHKPKIGETEGVVKERIDSTQKRRLARQRQHNRRQTLFRTRLNICEGHLPSEDCRNPTSNEVAYSHIYSIIETLGAEGMSSDESDIDQQGRATFMAKRMPWRAKEVTEMLVKVDKDYNRTNMFGNQKSGNPARHRERRKGRETARKAPGRKPSNFYDQDWYRALSAKQKMDLGNESDVELLDIEDDD